LKSHALKGQGHVDVWQAGKSVSEIEAIVSAQDVVRLCESQWRNS
jgi:hypothetical protein